jgi:hypothetical protein
MCEHQDGRLNHLSYLLGWDACAGYVRRVTHDEIADRIGENLRNVLGTPADLAPKGKGNRSMP